MTKLVDKNGTIIRDIDDGKDIEIKGFLRPKLRRFHWPTQLKYIYDEFMNCVTNENK